MSTPFSGREDEPLENKRQIVRSVARRDLQVSTFSGEQRSTRRSEAPINYLSKTIKKIEEEKKIKLDSFLEGMYNTFYAS